VPDSCQFRVLLVGMLLWDQNKAGIIEFYGKSRSMGGLRDLFSEEKTKVRRVTLASASHLLLPTMSDSEIGGEPAIRK